MEEVVEQMKATPAKFWIVKGNNFQFEYEVTQMASPLEMMLKHQKKKENKSS